MNHLTTTNTAIVVENNKFYLTVNKGLVIFKLELKKRSEAGFNSAKDARDFYNQYFIDYGFVTPITLPNAVVVELIA